MDRALAEYPCLAGPTFSLADINVLSSVQRMPRWAPDLKNETVSPRVNAWLERLKARPAVQTTLSVSEEAPPLPPDAEALAFAIATAAAVRTLALIEVLFAQLVARYMFGQRTNVREAIGMALVVVGVLLLIYAEG